ncbi:MAG TPA: ABC transporter substrate-binding protein [Stellaceae bacterium]|nr:ABC transporter substrate-binding protein [Stellaceae bacterium]
MAFRDLALSALVLASGTMAAHAADPYRLPVIVPLTGPVAFLGQGEHTALELVQKAVNADGGINGQPLEFDFKDDQSNPQVSVQIVNEVIAGKPAIFLGSSLVASCRAVAPLVEQGGPVAYCFSPGIHPDKGSWSFTSSVSTLDLIAGQIRYFHQQGLTRIAAIVTTDATGQDAENGIKDKIALPENQGMQLVSLQHFNGSDVTVAAQIEAIKAANPQALIAWSTGTPIATVFRSIADSGLDIPVVTTGGNQTYQQMAQYKSFLPKDLLIPSPGWVVRDGAKLGPEFVKTHDVFYGAYEAIGKRPDVSSELAWDPAMITVGALRKLGTKATAAELHDYLEHLEYYVGIDGIFNFVKNPQRGLDGTAVIITRWDPQQDTWVMIGRPNQAQN